MLSQLLLLGLVSAYAANYYPTSDLNNDQGWEPYAPLTDEFDGTLLNNSKWQTKWADVDGK